jgi:N-acetylmuramic acid 6-phosphate etherase
VNQAVLNFEKQAAWENIGSMRISSGSGRTYLGIEGGATRTVAMLADENGKMLGRVEAGPANLKLMTGADLVALLRSIASLAGRPDALAIGLAGAWVKQDWERIKTAAAKVWPRIPCYATSDLETALTAAGNDESQQVLIVSGTGSCSYGKSSTGKQVKVGGWGHILGDKGSGYEIGLRGLKAAAYYYDQQGTWPKLGTEILRALGLNEPNDLIAWAPQATKADIAGLAIEVFSAWKAGDKIAGDILAAAAASLARDGVACARRLFRARTEVEFVLAGSILLKQERFAKGVARAIKRLWPNCTVKPLKRESVWGAVELARRNSKISGPWSVVRGPWSEAGREKLPYSKEMSPTEQRNPRSMHLDKLPLATAIRIMLEEDSKVPKALLKQTRRIERVVNAITKAFRQGGRLFYVGAGTSGRLGVLDASECPPTFRTPPAMVQGIIAGGEAALRKAIEGAEDDVAAGARAVGFRGITRRDVVIGIAASGTTPFVWGALKEAKRRKAITVLVCFNPELSIPPAWRPTIVIAPNLGPELLTGSTRLKAGTATKLLLNIFTTLAMVRLGKVISNLMIDLQPGNTKLKDRAIRIVVELSGTEPATARAALERSRWNIKKAVSRLRRRSGS